MPKMHQNGWDFQEIELTGIAVRHVQHLEQKLGDRWVIWKQIADENSKLAATQLQLRKGGLTNTEHCFVWN